MLFYTIVLLGLLAFGIVVLGAVAACVRTERRKEFRRRMKLKLKGGLLRGLMVFYVPVFISIFLNVKHISFEEVFDYVSFATCILFAALMVVIPAYYGYVLCRHRNHLDDLDTVNRYGALYEDLKRTSMTALLTYQLFLLRRLLLVAVLFSLGFSLYIQISLIIIINVLAVLQVVIVRPFIETRENLNVALSDGAFTLASSLLPFMAIGWNTTLFGDMMIYVLLCSIVLNGIV